MAKRTRHCLYCNVSFEGRSDKKYCCDQSRASAHNKDRSHFEQDIIDLNRALRRNRRILKTLCPTGKSTIRKDELVLMGFQFELFTFLFPTKRGVYYLIYDYAYLPIYERETIKKVLIVEKQKYMVPFDPWKYIKG